MAKAKRERNVRPAQKVSAPKGPTSIAKESRISPWLVLLPLSLIIIGLGLRFAESLTWYGDDIFITLRYIQNWFEGNGLVYNPGEYVEGYTHFLWMLCTSFLVLLGSEPLQATLNLGLFCYLVTMVSYVFFSLKLQRPHTRYILPFTLFALAWHHHFNAYATSGLETMMFTMFLSLLFLVAFLLDLRRPVRLGLIGLIFTALIMTRPDGGVVIIVFNLLFLVHHLVQRRSFKSLITDGLTMNAALILILIPYLIWRVSYYGYLVPNTYYAKAGYYSMWERGFAFLWQYFRVYINSWPWVLALIIFNVLAFRRADSARSFLREAVGNRDFRLFNTMAIITLAYIFGFIAKVGGDFMYSRFVIPLVPLFYAMIEIALVQVAKGYKKSSVLPLAIVGYSIFFLFLRADEEENRLDFTTQTVDGQVYYKINDDIVDERLFYMDIMPKLEIWAKSLAPFFEGMDSRVLNSGQCAFTYWGDFNYVLEKYGLTDEHIAHQEVAREDLGRAGHNKPGSYEYFLERGVQFSFYRSFYKGDEWRPAGIILGDNSQLKVELFYFHKERIATLAQRLGNRFQYTDFPAYMRNKVRELSSQGKREELQEFYEKSEEFYFRWNDDAETLRDKEVFQQVLAQMGS